MGWCLLPFERYFEFSGRSTRREYWLYCGFCGVVYTFATVLMVIGGLGLDEDAPDLNQVDATFWFGFAIAALFGLATIIPSLSVTVRRLHDRDLSGWWYVGLILAGLIPLVNLVVSLIFLVQLCRGGTAGTNRFGADPRYTGLR